MNHIPINADIIDLEYSMGVPTAPHVYLTLFSFPELYETPLCSPVSWHLSQANRAQPWHLGELKDTNFYCVKWSINVYFPFSLWDACVFVYVCAWMCECVHCFLYTHKLEKNVWCLSLWLFVLFPWQGVSVTQKLAISTRLVGHWTPSTNHGVWEHITRPGFLHECSGCKLRSTLSSEHACSAFIFILRIL